MTVIPTGGTSSFLALIFSKESRACSPCVNVGAPVVPGDSTGDKVIWMIDGQIRKVSFRVWGAAIREASWLRQWVPDLTLFQSWDHHSRVISQSYFGLFVICVPSFWWCCGGFFFCVSEKKTAEKLEFWWNFETALSLPHASLHTIPFSYHSWNEAVTNNCENSLPACVWVCTHAVFCLLCIWKCVLLGLREPSPSPPF